MSQRIKELLDSAVADVEPRAADPVRTVVRRARVARLRAVAIGGLAVTVAVAGGLVGVGQVTGGGAPAQLGAPPADEQPPVPQVRNGRIVAGPVSLPVPQGWQVAPAGSGPCDYPDRTVRTVKVGQEPTWNQENPECHPADLEVEGSWETNVAITYAAAAPGHTPLTVFATGDGLTLTPKMIILRGGEPAWLDTQPAGDGTRTRLVMPWSKVIITMHVAEDVQRQIIDSITVTSRRPAGLVLPEQAAYIALTRPRPTDSGSDDEGKWVEKFVVAANDVGRVLDLLRAATVADKRGCAREGDATAQLVIATEFAPSTAGSTNKAEFSGPQLPTSPPDSWRRQLTTVVISLADGCFQAVSSDGGSVRLTAAALAELEALFKVSLR